MNTSASPDNPADDPGSSHADESPPWEEEEEKATDSEPAVAKPAARRAPETPLAPLSDEEATRFKELDQLVYRHSIGYLMVADALKEINARKLFRANHKNFEDYCLARHGFGKQQGNNLVQAANLMEKIKPHLEDKDVGTPVTEGVIRELRRIKDDEQCALAYVEAVQQAGGDDKVTAKDVRAAVKAVIAPTREPAAAKPAKKDLVREHLSLLREALKAGKSAEELEPLLDALCDSLGL